MINQIGKKGKAWIKARNEFIKKSVASGRIEIEFGGSPEGRCEVCGEWNYLDVDHIVSRGRGGSNEEDNLQFVCRKCHTEKHN